jgi:hypothetical protein
MQSWMAMSDPQPNPNPAKTQTGEPADPPTTDESRRCHYLDEQEDESFPASDPHSDWAGPGD